MDKQDDRCTWQHLTALWPGLVDTHAPSIYACSVLLEDIEMCLYNNFSNTTTVTEQ